MCVRMYVPPWSLGYVIHTGVVFSTLNDNRLEEFLVGHSSEHSDVNSIEIIKK